MTVRKSTARKKSAPKRKTARKAPKRKAAPKKKSTRKPPKRKAAFLFGALRAVLRFGALFFRAVDLRGVRGDRI